MFSTVSALKKRASQLGLQQFCPKDKNEALSMSMCDEQKEDCINRNCRQCGQAQPLLLKLNELKKATPPGTRLTVFRWKNTKFVKAKCELLFLNS